MQLLLTTPVHRPSDQTLTFGRVFQFPGPTEFNPELDVDKYLYI